MVKLDAVPSAEEDGARPGPVDREMHNAQVELLRAQALMYRAEAERLKEQAKLFQDVQNLVAALCVIADGASDVVKLKRLIEEAGWLDKDAHGNPVVSEGMRVVLREKNLTEMMASIAKGKQIEERAKQQADRPHQQSGHRRDHQSHRGPSREGREVATPNSHGGEKVAPMTSSSSSPTNQFTNHIKGPTDKPSS